ncbi:MAG: efflux RND transporter periplasmic adaptor subunit [Pseudomonadales bacterium]|nr:efflux RND transporter periplasmic adaptor subunit [Pseudomonadales bacterium]
MDIIKTPTRRPFYRRYWYVLVAFLLIGAVLIVANRYRNVTYLVSEESLLIDTVNAGELRVTVRGYGQLSSRDVYWIGAETEGRVARILVRPGDQVDKGDVLVELTNPQLLQQLRDAELELAARKADFKANRIARESQLLDLKTQAANAGIDHQTARMDLDAKSELMAKGLEIVSRIDFESTQLSVQKYQQRLDMEQQRVIKSEESMHATNEAEQARLLQTENEVQKFRDQVHDLAIRATVSGIVQEMNLELGQQVSRGGNITRIARPDQLVAEVQIQELQVNDIQIGMQATVDTRSSKITGVVSRIDPAVVDGSVLVEIELTGLLPAEVRPDLNIEANIEVDHIEQTRFVRRPVFARPYSVATVYRLNAEGDIADKVSVEYGQASTNYIEIIDGVEVGDRLVVSDPSAFSTHERILIR